MSETKAQKWLRENALFGCQFDACAQEVSYHANQLAIWKKKPICDMCFDDLKYDEKKGKLFGELPPFDPFQEAFK